MNNKGWGLSDMLVLCAILVFALLVAVIVYYNTFGDSFIEDKPTISASDYAGLELKAENAAYSYVNDNSLTTEDTIKVSISKLIDEGYLEKLNDSNNVRCTGYVLYDGKDYNAYIKCGSNYKTSGYTSSLDE